MNPEGMDDNSFNMRISEGNGPVDGQSPPAPGLLTMANMGTYLEVVCPNELKSLKWKWIGRNGLLTMSQLCMPRVAAL